MARMQQLYDRYRDRGFAVIAVNADEQHITDQTINGLKETVDRSKLSIWYCSTLGWRHSTILESLRFLPPWSLMPAGRQI